MILLDRNNIVEVLMLEIISFTPVVIILGNLVPPFPLKFHFYFFGLAFLCAMWILIKTASKKWVLYFAGFYLILQPMLGNWDVKSFIDFFFGPFVLLIMIDLWVNNKIPKKLLLRYQKRFYYLLWVPVIIAVLQFFEILPLTFWNATYVNSAKIDGVYIPRPNGFLYHGSELSIIICFLTLFQLFKPEKESFWRFILLFFICIATYFKSITACVLLIFLYYLFFINSGSLSKFKLISKKRIYWYGGLILIVSIAIAVQYFYTVYKFTSNPFPNSMLTGRGGIWNVYLEGIKDFTFWNYLFGSGIGSAFEIFKDYAVQTYAPLIDIKKSEITVLHDTHNAVLSIFVNSGIIGVLFIAFIFKMIYSLIISLPPSKKWNQKIFIAVFLIPLFTIGITINMYEMAIIWPCIGFLFYKWYSYARGLKD
ncbi:MAG: O-antigen ligase family protein [Vicingaceae bacterium]